MDAKTITSHITDYLQFRKALLTKAKHHERIFLRILYGILFAVVVTVVVLALWGNGTDLAFWAFIGILVVALLVYLVAVQVLKPFSRSSIRAQLTEQLAALKVAEQVSRILQGSEITTLQQQFTLSKYQLIQHKLQCTEHWFWVETYWLTPQNQVVEVTYQWTDQPETETLVSRLLSKNASFNILLERPDLYRKVHGEPAVVQ